MFLLSTLLPTLSKKLLLAPKWLWYLIVVLGVAAVGWHHLEKVKQEAFKEGYAKSQSEYAEIELRKQQAYELEVERLTDLVNKTQAELASKLSDIEKATQTKLQDVIDEKETTIDKLRRGNLRLSIDLRDTTAQAATAELAGSTAVRYATYRAELSEASSEFLIGLAADADDTAVRLGQCQQTVRTYLESVAKYNSTYTQQN